MALDLDRSSRSRPDAVKPRAQLAGLVTALGYGTTGLSLGQRASGLTDWYRDGTLSRVCRPSRHATWRRCRATSTHGGREPADLGPDRVAGTVRPWSPSGGASVLVHGAAAQSGRWRRARTRGRRLRHRRGRSADRQTVLDFGAQEFVDLENDVLEDIREVDRRSMASAAISERSAA